MENKGAINAYICENLHTTISIIRDAGTTPLFIPCPKCGTAATSLMYQVSQKLTPEYEWFKPDESVILEEARNIAIAHGISMQQVVDSFRSHVNQGGLFHRPIEGQPESGALKTGVEWIAQARDEQLNKHRYDAAHDAEYTNELKMAAIYILTYFDDSWWPTGWREVFAQKLMAKPEVEQIAHAGAFLAAEIDRIQNQKPCNETK